MKTKILIVGMLLLSLVVLSGCLPRPKFDSEKNRECERAGREELGFGDGVWCWYDSRECTCREWPDNPCVEERNTKSTYSCIKWKYTPEEEEELFREDVFTLKTSEVKT